MRRASAASRHEEIEDEPVQTGRKLSYADFAGHRQLAGVQSMPAFAPRLVRSSALPAILGTPCMRMDAAA